MNGLKQQITSEQWKKDGGQFIPHPTTWLNGDRWEDEVEIKNEQSERREDYGPTEDREDDIRF